MAGVIAEAIYATLAAQPVLRQELGPNSPPAQGKPLTYRDLFWFHLPLAGTSFLILLVQPMVAYSLARLDNPTQSLAAWPLVFQVVLIARAAAFALPEVVIALTKGPETLQPIRRFSAALAVGITLLIALFIYTSLVSLYLFDVQDATPAVGEAARQGLFFFLPLPGLTVLLSWLRGLLINTHATQVVNAGMAVHLLVTAAILFVGVQTRLPGIFTAAIALNGAHCAELLTLWWGVQRSIREIAERPLDEFTLARA
ncbi:MAG: hypothetical protein ACREE7_13355 [Dongiaceae bacterium]